MEILTPHLSFLPRDCCCCRRSSAAAVDVPLLTSPPFGSSSDPLGVAAPTYRLAELLHLPCRGLPPLGSGCLRPELPPPLHRPVTARIRRHLGFGHPCLDSVSLLPQCDTAALPRSSYPRWPRAIQYLGRPSPTAARIRSPLPRAAFDPSHLCLGPPPLEYNGASVDPIAPAWI